MECIRNEYKREIENYNKLEQKYIALKRLWSEEIKKWQEQLADLNARLRNNERENRDLQCALDTNERKIVLQREEINELKCQKTLLQNEVCQLKSDYNQLKILHQQTENSLINYQHRLTDAERQLEASNIRLNAYNTNRTSDNNNNEQLRSEVAALRSTYTALEHEKDKLLTQLDDKTQQVLKLEKELNSYQEKRYALETQIRDLEEQLEKLCWRTRERAVELEETTTETKSLRHQIAALKESRDKATAENGRLINDLAESQAQMLTLNKKLNASECEIEHMKCQLQQYVQEVKRVEDLLMNKERERDELLEHYRSLSHEAVLLEGNNQSMEVEAAEFRRQLLEAEAEIEKLKTEIKSQNAYIEQLEDKVTALTSQNTSLEHQLEEALDEQRLLKADLAARKELCDKLDNQKDKLNAEVAELNEIRKKLEHDIEKAHKEMELFAIKNGVCTEALEDLLSATRSELENQIKTDKQISDELQKMSDNNRNLLQELTTTRLRSEQNAQLAEEYSKQNEKLRHNITDTRFQQARSRERTNDFYSSI